MTNETSTPIDRKRRDALRIGAPPSVSAGLAAASQPNAALVPGARIRR